MSQTSLDNCFFGSVMFKTECIKMGLKVFQQTQKTLINQQFTLATTATRKTLKNIEIRRFFVKVENL